VVSVVFIVVSAVLRGVSRTSMSCVVVVSKSSLVTCHFNLLPWLTPGSTTRSHYRSDSNAHQPCSFGSEKNVLVKRAIQLLLPRFLRALGRRNFANLIVSDLVHAKLAYAGVFESIQES
jgi:hypothetical protein